MKNLGVVRRFDDLGRLVIPVEMRKNLDLNPRDAVEIINDGDQLIIRKYCPNCIFCGNDEDVVMFEGKRVCTDCLIRMKKLV